MDEHEHHGPQHETHHEPHHWMHHPDERHSRGTGKYPLWAVLGGAVVVAFAFGLLAAPLLNPPTNQPAPTPPVTALPSPGQADGAQLKGKIGAYLGQLLASQGAPSDVSVQMGSYKQQNGMFMFEYSILKGASNAGGGTVYASVDGVLMLVGGTEFDLTKPVPTPRPTPTPVEVQKTARPLVQMFVMSFCPYGKQAEQGIGPAVALLNGTVDFEPHFIANGINSSLHGPAEAHEDARQLCVWKYYEDKWWDYVNYVNANCTLGDIETCWKRAALGCGINESKISECFDSEGAELMAAEETLASEKGAFSSPTVLINGAPYGGGRSPDQYKEGICGAFLEPPAYCSQTLSSTAPVSSGNC